MGRAARDRPFASQTLNLIWNERPKMLENTIDTHPGPQLRHGNRKMRDFCARTKGYVVQEATGG